MFNIMWFQTTWERKLGRKTDNIFTLERKQVKLEIKTLTSSFITRFVPKKK